MSYFEQFDDDKQENLKISVLRNTFLLLGNRKKNLIEDLHHYLKIIDVITIILVLVSGVSTVFSLEQNLYFVEIPETFIKKIDLYYSTNDQSFLPTIHYKNSNETTAIYNYCYIWSDEMEKNKTLADKNGYDYEYKVDVQNQTLTSLIPCFDNSNMTILIARLVTSGCTLIVLILIIVRSFLMVKFDKYRMIIKLNESYCETGYFKILLIEILLIIVHCPPGLNVIIEIPQRTINIPAFVSIEVILSILSLFFRFYHIFKYFSFHSRWYSYESEALCLECNTSLDMEFTLKAEFKERPFILLGITLILSIFLFGYSIRCIEMFFMPSSNQDWRYYWNGMWCVIITMATVGFGDFFPVSIIGRLITIISCFWGTFLISLIVAAMTVAVEFNTQEAISYDSIKAAHFELQLGTDASILLQRAFRYRKLMKKADNSTKFQVEKSVAFKHLKDAIDQFRRLRKNKSLSIEAMIIELSINKIEENLTTEIQKIKSQIVVIDSINKLLNEYIDTQEKIKTNNSFIYKELQELCLLKEKVLPQ